MKRSKDDFFEKISLKDYKTVKHYETRIAKFEEYLKTKSIEFETLYGYEEGELHDLLQRFVNWFAKNHSSNTVLAYSSSVRKYLHYRGLNISKEDFKENIELPNKGEKELYPLQSHEVKAILSELKYDYQAMFLCQLSGGFRIGELVQLKKKDFILGNERIIVRIPKEIAKFKRARTTIISKEAGMKITPILKKLDDNDLIFGTNQNYEFSVISKEATLRRCLRKIGLCDRYDDTKRFKINTHSFRAYFITKVSRHDPNLAKKMAGEKGYLLQYDRLTDEELLESYLKFEPDLLIYSESKKEIESNKKMSELEQKILEIEKEGQEDRKKFEKFFLKHFTKDLPN